MHSLKQQHGMTAIGWLVVLALIIIISLLTIKILPIYMNTFKVTGALNSLKTDIEAKGKTPAELQKMMLRRFDIDMLQSITPDEITITQGDHVYNVHVEHQFKEELLHNLYIVLIVDEAVDVPMQQ